MHRLLSLCVMMSIVACRGRDPAPPVSTPAPASAPEPPEPVAATPPATSNVPCHLYREAGLLEVAGLERVGICHEQGCFAWWRAPDGALSQHGATSDPLAWARFDEGSLRPAERYASMRHATLPGRVTKVRKAPLGPTSPVDFADELARAAARDATAPIDAYLLICWAHQRELPAAADALAHESGPEVRDEATIRPLLADIVLAQARRDLGEGVPRARVAATLERAARLHPLPEITALLDDLGDDGGPLPTGDDPAAWVAVLHDDVVYPEQRITFSHDGITPTWAGTSVPASPAWELVRLGWRALPAVIARMDDDQVARHDQRRLVRTVGHTARSVAFDITGARFGAAGFRSWWAKAHRLSEWDARVALIEDPQLASDVIDRNVEGLLALDPERARRQLRQIRRRLSHEKRVALDEALRDE